MSTFLTTTEVAEACEASTESVRRWVRRGLLHATRPTPTSPLRFRPEDVEALLQRATGGSATKLRDRTKAFLSITDVARLCAVHRTTVWRWISAGHLETVRIGGSTRIPQANLQAFIDRGQP